MLEELDIGNMEGDAQYLRGDLCPYIFIDFRIIYSGGPFLRGQRGTVDQGN